MKLLRKRGDTSNIFQVFIQDSSSSTGAGLTGLAFNSSGLTAYYHKDTDTTATAISLVTMTVGTFTSSGFKEIDATNMPGWYQLCPPDAALSTSGTPHSVGFHLKGATNMAPLPIEVQLIAADVEDSVRLGLTALPNATAGATNGLPLAVDSSGRVDVLKVNGTSQTARDLGASVLLSPGTGTGQISLSAGAVTAGTVSDKTGYSLTQAFPTNFSALGISAGGHVSNVDTLTTYTGNTVQTGDAYARLGAPAGASVSADVAAIKSDTGTILTDVNTGAGAIYTRIGAPAGASIAADIAAVQAKTTNLPTLPAAVGSAMTLTAAYDAAKTAAQASDVPTANISAIKTQTDKLAFTVAGQVDANIQYVNDVLVTGNGQSGTEWGP